MTQKNDLYHLSSIVIVIQSDTGPIPGRLESRQIMNLMS
jgi:hypothetical protein